MRLGYRLHISSGGLRDCYLLRSLTFGGKSEYDGGQGKDSISRAGFAVIAPFPFFPFFPFSSLGSPE